MPTASSPKPTSKQRRADPSGQPAPAKVGGRSLAHTRPAGPPSGRTLGQTLDQALHAADPLMAVLQGHQRSRACFSQMTPLLAQPLRAHVRAGPIDGARMSLLADHNAAAAKLRQLLPELLAAAQTCEPSITELRVRVLPRTAGIITEG